MKLYYLPGACSLSPHIVANEAGIPLTLDLVDRATKKTSTGKDFFMLNPMGLVPCLELDDGRTLTEGPAIVQYLADLKPEAKLMPPSGTFERYQAQEALNFVSTELHKQFTPLFNKEFPEENKDYFRNVLTKRFDLVGAKLKKSPYFLGETFTAADAYLFTVFRWVKFVKMDQSKFPDVKTYYERLAERPSIKKALEEEGIRA